MLTISCVVPTFNSARYLEAALDSIAAQSYRPIEVVVADDGSTDSTLDVVTGHQLAIKVVHHVERGPAGTRNLGLRASTGDLVAFLDPDDLWLPHKLGVQAALLDARPDVDAVVSLAQMFWDDADPEQHRYQVTQRAAPVAGYATTTLLARRGVFQEVGLFDSARWFSDATEWFIRARERGASIELVPEVLTLHRMHRDNLTRRREGASRQEFLALVKDTLDRRRSSAG